MHGRYLSVGQRRSELVFDAKHTIITHKMNKTVETQPGVASLYEAKISIKYKGFRSVFRSYRLLCWSGVVNILKFSMIYIVEVWFFVVCQTIVVGSITNWKFYTFRILII